MARTLTPDERSRLATQHMDPERFGLQGVLQRLRDGLLRGGDPEAARIIEQLQVKLERLRN